MDPSDQIEDPSRTAPRAVGVPSNETQARCSNIATFEGQWWVLHTKPRNEKALAAVLDLQSISYFLPLVSCSRTTRGRKRFVDLPLFPGYLFLCGTWEDREAALKTNRLVQVLEVGGQETLVADLRQIERVLQSHEPVDLYPRLREGAQCRVKSGPLVGLEGVVLRRRGPWRVYIAVHFIAQSAELELDPGLLEVLD